MDDFRNNRKSDRAISISVGYLLRNAARTSPFGMKGNPPNHRRPRLCFAMLLTRLSIHVRLIYREVTQRANTTARASTALELNADSSGEIIKCAIHTRARLFLSLSITSFYPWMESRKRRCCGIATAWDARLRRCAIFTAGIPGAEEEPRTASLVCAHTCCVFPR